MTRTKPRIKWRRAVWGSDHPNTDNELAKIAEKLCANYLEGTYLTAQSGRV